MFTDSVICFLEVGAVTAQGRVLHRQRIDLGVIWFISVQSLRLDIDYNNSRLNIFPS